MENGVVWELRVHSRSLNIAPFNRAHNTTSYLPFIVTMFLSCSFSEI